MATNEHNMHTVILTRPRVTEKTSLLGEGNVYTFEVDVRANKTQVREAIIALFSVKPLKVNITRIPKKTVIVRGKPGVRGGGKKALIYLKKGDKIEFV